MSGQDWLRSRLMQYARWAQENRDVVRALAWICALALAAAVVLWLFGAQIEGALS